MEKFLKTALKYVWALQSKTRLLAFMKEHPEFKDVPGNLAKGLLEIVGLMCQIKDEKETINMCDALN